MSPDEQTIRRFQIRLSEMAGRIVTKSETIEFLKEFEEWLDKKECKNEHTA